MHIAPVAATRFGQQETVEQKRHSTLAPGQLLQHGCGFFAEEHAAQRRHVQLAGLQALGEHAEELPQPVLQERARVFAGFPHVAGVRVQRLAGRKGLAPQRGPGEAEAARRVVGGFHLEQEQQAVDQDQAFVPEIAGKLGTVGKFGETFDIDGMVQHLLRELLDRFTRLLAEVARDPSLLHAGLVQNLLQRSKPSGCASAHRRRNASGTSRLRFHSGSIWMTISEGDRAGSPITMRISAPFVKRPVRSPEAKSTRLAICTRLKR